MCTIKFKKCLRWKIDFEFVLGEMRRRVRSIQCGRVFYSISKKWIHRMLFFPEKTHKTTLFGFFLYAETHREMACRRYKIYRSTCTLFPRTYAEQKMASFYGMRTNACAVLCTCLAIITKNGSVQEEEKKIISEKKVQVSCKGAFSLKKAF